MRASYDRVAATFGRRRTPLTTDSELVEGVTYTTEFIGTRRGFDRRSEAFVDKQGDPVTRRYSRDIGVVLAEVKGTSPNYALKGDELYVRARIISSKPKANPYRGQ